MNYAMFDPKRSTFKQGADRAMEIILLDQHKQPVNLTGAAVKVRIAALDNLFLEKDVAVIDPLAGVISLAFTDSEQLRAGFYEAEFEVTYPDQQKEIFPDSTYLKIQVVKNLKQRQDTFVLSTDLTRLISSMDEFGETYNQIKAAATDLNGVEHPDLQSRFEVDFKKNDLAIQQLNENTDKKANKISTVLNILDYSSYKVSNDWANAIQKAVNDIPNGGTIFFPKGATYQTSKQLPYISNLVIKGEGYNKSVIQYIGTESIAAFIDVTSNGLTLEDIRISGNYASNNAQSCHGVYMHTTSGQSGGHYLRNVYIDNFGGHGFYLGSSVYMCLFSDIRSYSNGMCGVYIDGTDCTFSNIHTQGNKQHGIAMMGGNNRLNNFNCIFNGKAGIAYAGYYQKSWNCQISNGQCQDNYYHGYIFDGATHTTISSLATDANGCAYNEALESQISAYGFVFKNNCFNINGAIQAINYRANASCISGLMIDSTCNNINIKYEELSKYFLQSPIVSSSLARIDTTSEYLYSRFIKSGKVLNNVMLNPNFATNSGHRDFACTTTVTNNILTAVSTANNGRVQIMDTKTTGRLYYVGFKVRAAAGVNYKAFVFKDDGNAPAYDNIVPNNNIYTGTGDWQQISFLYYLNNSLSTAYYPTVGFTAAGQSVDIKEAFTIDLTTDLGMAFSRGSTQTVNSIDFMDKLLKEKGWFASSLTLS